MSEWIGARYKYPATFRDAGENIQPDVDFWMAMPSGMIVSTTIIDPRQPVTFADSFRKAIQPFDASLWPASIRVPNDRFAKELRPIAGGIPVIVAPVPELDAAFGEMAKMTGSAAKPSYLQEGEIAEETVAEFFVAAQSLFKAAPWGLVQEHQIVGVDIPRLKVKGACLTVIAYPTLFCVDRAMEAVPVAERDFWIMSACAFAFVLFFKEHGEIFVDVERAMAIKASYINSEGLAVIFTAPY